MPFYAIPVLFVLRLYLLLIQTLLMHEGITEAKAIVLVKAEAGTLPEDETQPLQSRIQGIN